ncbi:MAG TPA: branched-chain amino acid ABC transporter permease [Rhizobacter sp.]
MKSRTTLVALGLGIAALLSVPFLLSQGLVNAAIQMLIAALFALAYNVLCGQAGMLSFGHAAYFGVGAFATVHAMNALGGTGLLPTPLLPLVGGAAGLLIGAVAGWFATQRTGTVFAMITLAIAELLHSLAPHLKSLFGGEAGLSAMRMPSMGLNFGSTQQMYYLTLAWVLLCALLLYVYTLTPVGRLALGLRENGHRLRFLGYDVHRLSVLVFSISAMFSGVAGGLQVLNNEAANYALFEGTLSASVVLNTYIGGVKVFLGPALGASLMTFFGYAVSDLTRSWLLYQGILFVLVMLFMPQGLAGMFELLGVWRRRFGLAALWPVLLMSVTAALLLTVGGSFLVELVQRLFSHDYRPLAAANPFTAWPPVSLFGTRWSPSSVLTWLVPVLLLATGGVLVALARRRFASLLVEQDGAAPAGASAVDTARSAA